MRVMHLRVRYGRGVREVRAAMLTTGWAAIATAPMATPEWRPACDVVESAREWIVQAELAGVTDEDVEVVLYEDSVIVQGVRPWRGTTEGVRVHLAELRYGPFRLVVDIPPDVDHGAVRATYDRGILTIVLPKTGAGGAR